MRRLFWLNVAAVVLFAGIAGYHYYRHRTRLVVGPDALLAPIASASTETELRARGETLARMAYVARKEGGHLHRAMGWLALGAACMFLWSAVSISEFHEELVYLREEVGDLRTMMADLEAAAGIDDDEDENEPPDESG